MPKQILREWIVDALESHDGRATLIQVCRHIWRSHEDDLWESGDLFYTWQYDVRWAATDLRQQGILRGQSESPRGTWELDTGVADALEELGEPHPGVRSPPWSAEELVLALDLYRRRGNLNARHREVVLLSEDLRSLPINRERPDNYRSPASVNRKLGNLASLDPGFSGSGLEAAGKLDVLIFNEFFEDPRALHAEAARVRGRYGLTGTDG